MINNCLHVLYQSDNNYAPYMGVSILSLLENNTELEQIVIHIIDDHISEENKRKISQEIAEANREVRFIDAEQILKQEVLTDCFAYGGSRKNKHSFLKLLLDEFIPENVERLVYIDCDTLVMGSISELLSIDMGKNVIGMSLDSLVDWQKELIGLSREDDYYNSGVILVDMKNWKSRGCQKRILEHAQTHSYGTVDQDLLNVEFRGEILRLPQKYNFQPHHLAYSNKAYFKCFHHPQNAYYTAAEIDEARNNIAIMHFFRYIGEQPWHKDNVHPCNSYFDAYLRKSLWKDYEKKKAKKGTIFVIEKILYKILPSVLFLRLFNFFFTIKLNLDKKNA